MTFDLIFTSVFWAIIAAIGVRLFILSWDHEFESRQGVWITTVCLAVGTILTFIGSAAAAVILANALLQGSL